MKAVRLVLQATASTLLLVIALALFERWVPRPLLRGFQRFTSPLFRPMAQFAPGYAVLETTGHRTGHLRHVPVGGRRQGQTFWLVAANGRRSHYVRNLEADPRVRVCVNGRWWTGTARPCPDDDARRRLLRMNPLNGLFIGLAGQDLLTVRVDLDP